MEKQFESKNIEEAIEIACKDLNVSKEEFDFVVVQEQVKGFFGIGSKNAIIKVTLNDNYNLKAILEFLSKTLSFYGQNPEIKVETIKPMACYSVKVSSDEPLSNLIGKHGHTMESIEHLLSVYVNKLNDHHVSITLDVSEYRIKREEFVKRIVNEAIQKVKKDENRKVSLEPMDSHERKIAHEILSHNADIRSYSVGSEPYRHIVIENAKIRISK
uniref:RNA-binding protein KhpB n=1 Tax=Mesoaciditoga lauensis TaxID=1495039 RepID=A0A7V3RF59_9BACT